MRDFRELKDWQKAHQLTLSVYRASTIFPAEEKFGLTSQLRRAAAAIPANIAEGCGRSGQRELGRFLQMAMGSASELEYHLLLAHDLGHLPADVHEQLTSQATEVKRMLTSFIQKLTADG
jgi:four helix bundle protein